ncbi:MAG: hypothetical protein HQK51_14995 [Oligoflexia bacterium]|nr:hypothetical protein [Oligoflexia bacterium]
MSSRLIVFLLALIVFIPTLKATSLDFTITASTDSMFRGTTGTDHGVAIFGNTDFNHELISNILSVNLGTLATNVPASSGKIEQDYYGTFAFNLTNDFFISPAFTYYSYYYLGTNNTFEYGISLGHKLLNAGAYYTDNYNGFKTSSTCYQLKGNVDLPSGVNANLAVEGGYLTYGDERRTAWSNYSYYVVSLSRTIDSRTFVLSFSDTIKRREVYSDGSKSSNNYQDQAIFASGIQRF